MSFVSRGIRTSPGRQRKLTNVPSKSRTNAHCFAARNWSRISGQFRNADRGTFRGSELRQTVTGRWGWGFFGLGLGRPGSSVIEIAVAPIVRWGPLISGILLRPLCDRRLDVIDAYLGKFRDQIARPAVDVVFPHNVPHVSHAAGSFVRVHFECHPYRIC